MIARLLAYPLLAAFVALVWLLLNQSLSPGQIILALLLGLGASSIMSALQQPGRRARNPAAMLRLAGFVVIEIVRSNIAVAKIILWARRDSASGFLRIRLEIDDPYALAVLACIVTGTPGSLWVNYNPANQMLLLHILDLVDEETWIEIVRGYERRLREIFQ